MDVTVMDTAGARRDAEGSSRPGRRAARVMVLILVGAVVIVGLWEWRSPNAFVQGTGGVGMYSQVGTTALFGVATPRQDMDPGVLTLHSIEPRVTEGDAEVDVVVCRPSPAAGGIGTARGDRALDRFCQSHRAADGAQMVPGDDLIVRVRSQEPGRVVVEGIEVTYSHGWRRGSQVIGLTTKATFGTESWREHLDGD